MNDSLNGLGLTPTGTAPGGEGDVFDRLVHARLQRLQAQADELSLIVTACAEHQVDQARADEGVERLVAGAADGTPAVGEFLAHELALALHVSPTSAALRMSQALNLRYRHPLLWAATMRLELEPWQATRVASDCAAAGLSKSAAQWVDAQLSAAAAMLPWPRALKFLAGLIVKANTSLALERAERARSDHLVQFGEIKDGSTTMFARLGARDGLFLDGMIRRLCEVLADQGETSTGQRLRAKALGVLATPGYATWLLSQDSIRGSSQAEQLELDLDSRPPVVELTGVDPETLLPKATLYVHVSDEALTLGDGVVRCEEAGPLPLGELRHLLDGTRLRVVRVQDNTRLPAVDAYEIPERLREAINTRHLVEVFPWSNRAARGCEIDHTEPFDQLSAAGKRQTRIENLGPLGKRSHRVKTHGGWQVTQVLPGVFHWQSPQGLQSLVTPSGTLSLSRERAGGRKTPVPVAA